MGPHKSACNRAPHLLRLVLALSPAFAIFHVEVCTTTTRQLIELESSSSPLKMQKVIIIRVGLNAFLAEVTGPVAPTQRAIFCSSFLETRLQCKSLEGWIGFLAFLVPKLWLKKQMFGKTQNPTNDILGQFGQMPYLTSRLSWRALQTL